LTLSAVAMAMLDGIIQKTAPITEPSKLIPDRPLAECLAEDSGFLMHAEVFSERLIESLHEYLSKTSP
jgi:hypothetical protein